MSKEKQIEEMIEAIKPFVSGFACGEESGSCELTDCRTCKARNLANGIYNAGFRKQSVWISVDDRLPEEDLPKDTERRSIRCLVATNKGSVKACVRQRYVLASTGELSPWCWSRDVFATPTHWMPLPEPPMMKGGE